MSNYKLTIAFCFTSLMIIVCIIWNAYNTISDNPIGEYSDARFHIKAAYNIVNHQCISPDKSAFPKPSAYREPLYSLYLSCLVAVNPGLKKLCMTDLIEDKESLQYLRYAQIPILLIISIAAAYLIYCITEKLLFSLLAFVLTGYSGSLLESMGYLKAEHLAVALLLTAVIFFYKSIKTKSWFCFSGFGASLALLVLTKAIFMYFIIFVVVFLFFLLKKHFLTRSQLVCGLISIILPYSVIVGGWMVRNYVHFDNFFITSRSGEAMAIRAQYNKMNTTEYFGSFLYWAPGDFARKILFKTYGENALEPDGVLGMLNRSNPEGYFLRGKNLKRVLNIKKSRNKYDVDTDMERKSINAFLAHPVKELLVSAPIFWRGIFYSDGLTIGSSYVFLRSTGITSIAYFLSLITFMLLIIIKIRWELFSIISMPLYLFIINALATHGLPRYNLPALGVMPVCFLAVVFYFINKRNFE